MSKKILSKYTALAILSFIVMIVITTYICITNDNSENDLRYWLENVILFFSINIFSATVLVAFFDRRDKEEKAKKQALVVNKLTKIATEISEYLAQLQRNSQLHEEYKSKMQGFVNSIKTIENSHLFEFSDLDNELLQTLEDITHHVTNMANHDDKTLTTLTKYVNKLEALLQNQ